MNNTEKKLDALIDALGFDVEESVLYESLYRDAVIEYKLIKRTDMELIKAMHRSIELMYGEFNHVEPEILKAFAKAGCKYEEI